MLRKRGLGFGGRHFTASSVPENISKRGSAEPQIRRLRCASLGMTKGGGASIERIWVDDVLRTATPRD
jgi:hypothetical protein